MNQMKLPDTCKLVLYLLTSNGHEAYVVGGCVRNHILGIPIHDYDICTSAPPEEVKKSLSMIHVVDTGLKHGTVTAIVGDDKYEVTTYRSDGEYTDYRHPDSIQFETKLEKDLSRRDFTMNAICYHPDRGFVDPLRGAKDIEHGKICCVGNPIDRFKEDPLRILRAVRFESQLAMSTDQSTYEAMFQLKNMLALIPAERIQAEFVKILQGPFAMTALRKYRDIIAVFIPEIVPMFECKQHNEYHKYDVWEHTLHVVQECMDSNSTLRLAAFFHDIAKPLCKSQDKYGCDHFYRHPEVGATITESILRRLRFDNKTIHDVCALVKYHDSFPLYDSKRSIISYANKLGDELFESAYLLRLADITAQKKDVVSRIKFSAFAFALYQIYKQESAAFKIKDLEINGNDIMNLGVPQGKQVGEILNRLLDLVINDEVENDKDALTVAALEMIRNDS